MHRFIRRHTTGNQFTTHSIYSFCEFLLTTFKSFQPFFSRKSRVFLVPLQCDVWRIWLGITHWLNIGKGKGKMNWLPRYGQWTRSNAKADHPFDHLQEEWSWSIDVTINKLSQWSVRNMHLILEIGLSPAKHLKRPKGESTCVANLRRAQTRVCTI